MDIGDSLGAIKIGIAWGKVHEDPGRHSYHLYNCFSLRVWRNTSSIGQRSSITTPTTPVSTTPATSNIAGNWQFSATSNTPGAHPFSIAGSIGQSDAAVNGALHIDGSDCFDRLITRGLTGNVAADMTALTVTGMDGQVVALTGHFSNGTFTGTYTIKGGYADADEGTVIVVNIPPIANLLSGTFTDDSTHEFVLGWSRQEQT